MEYIVCHCGEKIESPFSKKIEIGNAFSIIEEIKAGTFLNMKCEKCGTVLKPDISICLENDCFKILYVKEEDRNLVLQEKIKAEKDATIAIGIEELLEKLLIAKKGLDQSIVEYIKYLLISKYDKENKDELKLKLAEVNEMELIFHVSGIELNKIGIIKTTMEFYSKIKNDLKNIEKTEAFCTITKGNYISAIKVI